MLAGTRSPPSLRWPPRRRARFGVRALPARRAHPVAAEQGRRSSRPRSASSTTSAAAWPPARSSRTGGSPARRASTRATWCAATTSRTRARAASTSSTGSCARTTWTRARVGRSARTSPGAATSSPRRKSIVRSWMHSPGHRANILNPAFREIGIGVVTGAPEAGTEHAATYATSFGAASKDRRL